MSAVTTTTWSCDRCGITDDVKPDEQPTGWGWAYLTSPPKASLEHDTCRSWDLCRKCRDDAARWFATPPPQAAP